MPRDTAQDPRGFSRRDFFRGSGAAVAASALATAARQAVAEDGSDSKVAAGPRDITLHVNGKDRQVRVEPNTSLLTALRNELNLTGCKEACETANCGACTVLIDGKAGYSCCRLAIETTGKKIATVESLVQGAEVDPVPAGFVKHDAMQCGFCTPGFVMATRAFLDAHPNASLEEIRKGLGGNLCRCGTYAGITACAVELAKKGGA